MSKSGNINDPRVAEREELEEVCIFLTINKAAEDSHSAVLSAMHNQKAAKAKCTVFVVKRCKSLKLPENKASCWF